MTLEMRRALARLPYEEKLRRVAELIEFSRRFRLPARSPAPAAASPAPKP